MRRRLAAPNLDVASLAVIALCGLILHRDALFGGPAFYERDTQLFYFPLSHWVSTALQSGHYPLWLPDIFTGYPIFADGELGLLYPPQVLLLWLLPAPIAMAWLRVLHVFIAGAGTFWLLRTLRLDPLPALGGALVFAFGSFLTAQMHHENVIRSAVWLPAVVLCLERACCAGLSRRGVGWSALGALALGQSAVGVHVQPVLMIGLATALYVLYRALAQQSATPLIFGGILGAGGAALAAAQIIPLFEWALLSFRRGGVSYEFASTFNLSGENLGTVIFPYFFRLPDAASWWTLWQQWEITLYVGIPTLALGIVGIIFARHAALLYFVPLGLLSLLIGMSLSAPLINLHELVWSVPGFSFLRAPGRFSMLVVFACAGLAGLGLQALSVHRGRMLVALAGALPAVGLLAALLALVPMWRQNVDVAQYLSARAQYPLDWRAVLSGFETSLDFGTVKTAWSLALLVLTAVAFIVWLALGARRTVFGQAVVVGLLAVDLLVFAYDYHPQAPLETFSPSVPPGVRTGARVLLYEAPNQPDIEPNQLLLAQIDTVEGYSSLPSQRHVEAYNETIVQPYMFDMWSAEYILEARSPADSLEVNGVQFRWAHPLAGGFGGAPSVTFRAPSAAGSASAIRLVGTLSFAFKAPHGITVGTLTVDGDAGRQVLPIRAGIELSERAFDRPSLAGLLQHQRAAVAADYEDATLEGEVYVAHLYQAEIPLAAGTVRSITFAAADPGVLTQLHGLALVSQSGVYSMGLGHREPLRQVGPNVIQNPQALPRAFVLPRAQAYTTARRPGMTPTQIVATNDIDFTTQVLIEGDSGLSALPGPPTHTAQAAALESEGPNALRITARADVSSYLVVNDFYHRGWVAYVDGERTRVLIANALFRAVPIEAGQHTVEMRFEPVSHVIGAAVSLVALVLTLALIGFGFTRIGFGFVRSR